MFLKRSREAPLEHVLDLVRLANGYRLQARTRLARAILRLAQARCRAFVPDNALALAWIHGALANCDHDVERLRRFPAHMEIATVHAHRTGASTFSTNHRVMCAFAYARSGLMPHASYDWVRRLSLEIASLQPDIVATTGAQLADLLLYCGFGTAMETLIDISASMELRPHVRTVIRARRTQLRFALGDARSAGFSDESWSTTGTRMFVEQLHHDSQVGWGSKPLRIQDSTIPCEAAFAFFALATRRKWHRMSWWPSEWRAEQLAKWALACWASHLGGADLVVALLLLPHGELPTEMRVHLAARLESDLPSRPTLQEWSRTLAQARLSWERLRFLTALRLVERAKSQATVLRRVESGPAGREAAEEAMLVIDAQRLVVSPPQVVAAPRQQVEQEAAEPNWYRPWVTVIEQVRRARRCTLQAVDARELTEFLALVKACDRPEVTGASPCDPAAQHRLILEVNPHTTRQMLQAQVPGLLSGVSQGLPCIVAVAAVDDIHSSIISELGPLSQAVAGLSFALPSLCDTPHQRLAVFSEMLKRRGRCSIKLSTDAAAMIGAHSWSGGLAEIDGLAREVAMQHTHALLSAADLASIGWSPTVAQVIRHHPKSEVLVRELRSAPLLSSDELARRTKTARRTAVRLIGRLAEAGIVERVGRGRAARYRLVHPQAADSST